MEGLRKHYESVVTPLTYESFRVPYVYLFDVGLNFCNVTKLFVFFDCHGTNQVSYGGYPYTRPFTHVPGKRNRIESDYAILYNYYKNHYGTLEHRVAGEILADVLSKKNREVVKQHKEKLYPTT